MNAQNRNQFYNSFSLESKLVQEIFCNGKSARNMEPGVHQASHKQAGSNKLRQGKGVRQLDLHPVLSGDSFEHLRLQ